MRNEKNGKHIVKTGLAVLLAAITLSVPANAVTEESRMAGGDISFHTNGMEALSPTIEPGSREDNIEGVGAGKVRTFKKDIGEGKEFEYEIRELQEKRSESEFLEEYTYQVRVRAEGAVMQTFEMVSTQEDCFYFEDINADGYYDICCEYCYGANGGSMNYHIWSHSKQQYVTAEQELIYGYYGVDGKTRRLYVHEHSSAISGREITYQWAGETDCEMVQKFVHQPVADNKKMHVLIKTYEDGSLKKVLSDYKYGMKEYEKRQDEIWSIDCANFLWEKEIVNRNGEKRILRYAQNPGTDKKGNAVSGYMNLVYVFREDTYLEKINTKKSAEKYESVRWDEKKKCLFVSCGGKELQMEIE